MYYLLIGLIIVAALLLCFVVMIQNSKGGGLASSFASSNQIMGVRKTTDFLEKATWSLAVFIAVVSICASKSVSGEVVSNESILQQEAVETQMVNPEVAPDFSQPATAPVDAPVESAN